MTAGSKGAASWGSHPASPAVTTVLTPWKLQGLDTIRRVLEEKGEVTSDDVHFEIGDPPGDPNQMGALFRDAVKAGLIQWSGRLAKSTRPSAKRRDIKVWIASESNQGRLLA